jgi:hypothetical protein
VTPVEALGVLVGAYALSLLVVLVIVMWPPPKRR